MVRLLGPAGRQHGRALTSTSGGPAGRRLGRSRRPCHGLRRLGQRPDPGQPGDPVAPAQSRARALDQPRPVDPAPRQLAGCPSGRRRPSAAPVGSRRADPSSSEPAFGAAPRQARPSAVAQLATPAAFLIDPASGHATRIAGLDGWRPVVDPSGRWVAYWSGTLVVRSGQWGLAAVPGPARDRQLAGRQAAADAATGAAAGHALSIGDVSDWDLRWDCGRAPPGRLDRRPGQPGRRQPQPADDRSEPRACPARPRRPAPRPDTPPSAVSRSRTASSCGPPARPGRSPAAA